LATNHIVNFTWNPAAGDIGFFAESGGGTNLGKANNVTDGVQAEDRQDQSMLMTLRVGPKSGAPTVMHVRMSINDQIDIASFDVSGGAGVPQGGTSSTGLQWGGPSGGYLQEFKWSFGEITDQQILDDFARLLDIEGGGAPADTTAPIITNLSPPASTQINTNDTISFDIIDPDSGGLFTGVVVFVSYPDGSTEIIHDGDTFRGSFTASPNNRTSIANGFNYAVRPAGGWQQTPTIEYVAIDQGGNLGQVA
jgi:hypothetical protein